MNFLKVSRVNNIFIFVHSLCRFIAFEKYNRIKRNPSIKIGPYFYNLRTVLKIAKT